MRLLQKFTWMLAVAPAVGCADANPSVTNEHKSTDLVVSNVSIDTSPSVISSPPVNTGAEETSVEFDLPNFTDAANFFALPDTTPVRQEVAIEKADQAEAVRLIGFINVSPNDAKGITALLKVGDRMTRLRVGDKYGEIELLAIENRSITLQHNRDRWTLAMMNQPIVNAASPVAKRRSRPRSTPSNPLVAASSVVPTVPFPDPAKDHITHLSRHDDSVGASDSVAIPEMPEIPELPEMPELPGLEDLP